MNTKVMNVMERNYKKEKKTMNKMTVSAHINNYFNCKWIQYLNKMSKCR